MANPKAATSKNQTAAERAALGEELSGKHCAKCGGPIKRKDLLHVQTYDGRRKAVSAFHKGCYA